MIYHCKCCDRDKSHALLVGGGLISWLFFLFLLHQSSSDSWLAPRLRAADERGAARGINRRARMLRIWLLKPSCQSCVLAAMYSSPALAYYINIINRFHTAQESCTSMLYYCYTNDWLSSMIIIIIIPSPNSGK